MTTEPGGVANVTPASLASEQRRRSQVRADAGSLLVSDAHGACGACHGGGAAAAESLRPPRPGQSCHWQRPGRRSGPVRVAAAQAGRGCGAQSRRPGPRGTYHAGCADRTGCWTREIYPSRDRRLGNIRVGLGCDRIRLTFAAPEFPAIPCQRGLGTTSDTTADPQDS